MTEDRPPKPLLGNILHLAKATAQDLQAKERGSTMRRCSECDAARPADAPLDVCAYCGARFEGVAPDPGRDQGDEA